MGFETCHPAVNLLFFVSVTVFTAVFDHPVPIIISFLCAFLYSVKRNGKRAFVFDSVLVLLTAVFALYYSTYNHFGVTVIGKNFIGNRMTLESVLYGAALGAKVSSLVMWGSCILSVFSSDKALYLLGRASPKFSLFASVILRTVPKIRRDAKALSDARRGVGKGPWRGGVTGIKNAVSVFSALITRSLDSFAESSDSMRSRGSDLRGRSAFSVYRFDNRDRVFVVVMFALIAATAAGGAIGKGNMIYDPAMIFPPVTPGCVLFFCLFAALCLTPLSLELYTEYRFKRSRDLNFGK